MNNRKNIFGKVDPDILKHLSLITQLGLTMVSSILIFFFIFLGIVRFFDLHPFFLIIGIFLGISSGFLGSYKLLKRFYEKNK